MKHIFLNLFLILSAYCLSAQTALTIQGTVINANGSPVPNWYVVGGAVDPADTIVLFNAALTDANGFYSFTLDVPPGVAEVNVSTFNGCNDAPADLHELVPAGVGQATVDFQICGDTPVVDDCEASMWYSSNSMNVEFYGDYFALDGSDGITYHWDFGDGTTGTEQNPAHTYVAEGVYSVILTITGETGCTATTTSIVYVFNEPPFQHCWTWINLTPEDSLTFSFSAEYYSVDSILTAVSYLWDFGDGTGSTEANPTHIYPAAGLYIVTVEITGPDGCTAYASYPFSTDFPPLPECQAAITYQQIDTTTFAFFSSSFNANGASIGILSYAWDFGDGGGSVDANPVHTYADQGIYVVQLHVVTEDLCEAYTSAVVFANNCPVDTFWYGCQAMFSAGWFDPNGNPAGGNPLTVSFFDLSIGVVETWLWDFGDGSTWNLSNPAHTYAAPGIYTVTLTITTTDGCESTATYDIYVGDNCPWTPEPDCQAMFLPLPDSIAGTGIQFIDLSVSSYPVQSWSWDFGDGSTGNEQNPYHVYDQDGVYTVSLEITADSCNSVISFEIDTDNPWRFNDQPALLGRAGATTRTQEHPAFEALKVFPNPATTALNLAFFAAKSGDYELNVADLNGKVLMRTQQHAESGHNVANLATDQLPSGLYLVELRSAEGVQAVKFVKE